MKILVLAGGFDQIALIQELQSRGHDVILADYLNNPPAKSFVSQHFQISTLDENAVLKILNDNPDRLYQNHELYNISLVEYAFKNSVQIVDMRKEMLLSENYRNLMCLDGIHPNEKGYKFMSEIWIRELPEVQKEF